ncbi:MAG: hypothetical protein Q9160_000907 [Pyrenula sp. 1 TL-2023]
MCGIHAAIGSKSDAEGPDQNVLELLQRRGPDCLNSHKLDHLGIELPGSNPYRITLTASVLALRGGRVQHQPLVNNSPSCVFCWNGDAWKHNGIPVTGNDTAAIFKLLLAVSKNSTDRFLSDVLDLFAKIDGPFSFVFYNAAHSKLFYGRDRLGRRSLLQSAGERGIATIMSVSSNHLPSGFSEVDAKGIHVLDLETTPLSPTMILWPNPLPSTNDVVPLSQIPPLTIESQCIDDLRSKLYDSLYLRVSNLVNSLNGPPELDSSSNSRLAILFSGGLDCTLLARLSHEVLPLSSAIDLLNVAFENPRSVAASNGSDASPYETCPDRITGRASHAELQRICPDRIWRFVAINVPFTESDAHRPTIIQLMAPHNTEMDLSIAKALYFAARGSGVVADNTSETRHTYTTPARVLLSGLGADELFGGYSRHKTAFDRRGYTGLIEELDLDTRRLGQRNLGRDDRVISHWGRQARYPFLDEAFMSWAVQLPVWEKCGFGEKPSDMEPKDLDPAKKALRLLAWKLGMHNVAREKKRAIQFGARTAKMDVNRVGKGRPKGTDLVH